MLAFAQLVVAGAVPPLPVAFQGLDVAPSTAVPSPASSQRRQRRRPYPLQLLQHQSQRTCLPLQASSSKRLEARPSSAGANQAVALPWAFERLATAFAGPGLECPPAAIYEPIRD